MKPHHLVFILIFFCFQQTYAQFNSNMVAAYRSVPSGLNLVATGAYDGLLWGQVDKAKPLYGYYRAGLKLGGTPSAAAFVQLAPVAPLIFEVQKGTTYRFLKSGVFDCKQVYCFGVVDRTDVSVKLAAGYKNFVGLLSYLWRDVGAPQSSDPISAELENMTMSPGHHSYTEFSVAAGLLLSDDRFAGALYTTGEFSEGNKRSSSAYAVYRWKWREFDVTAGVGSYVTDERSVGGNGALLVLSKKFGDSLALF